MPNEHLNNILTINSGSSSIKFSLYYMGRSETMVLAGEIESLCRQNGIKSKSIIKSGHPVEVIVREAGKLKTDLIVIGSHGKSAIEATVLGSVTYGVIHKDTKIPVLLMRT